MLRWTGASNPGPTTVISVTVYGGSRINLVKAHQEHARLPARSSAGDQRRAVT